MIKRFKQYNESIRDQMTPVDDEGLRRNMGEEKFNAYKNITNAMKYLKPPFEVSSLLKNNRGDSAEMPLVGYNLAENEIFGFRTTFRFVEFIISFDTSKNMWTLKHENLRRNNVKNYHNTWDEVFQDMANIIKMSLNKDIKDRQKDIDIQKSAIDDMKEQLGKLNDML